jgi:hypothetical protein
MKFLGVNDLSTKEALFGAPVEDTDNMPFVEGTQIRQVRFDWEKGPKTGNRKSLDIIAGYAKTHGTEYVSGIKEELTIVQLGDLKERMYKKFSALQRIIRGSAGGAKSGREGAAKDNRAKGVRVHSLSYLLQLILLSET